MSNLRVQVEGVVRKFLASHNKGTDADLGTPLFADGVGLDSLETAELSAVLEDEFGRDPFSVGDMPQSIGEVLDFYGASDQADDQLVVDSTR